MPERNLEHHDAATDPGLDALASLVGFGIPEWDAIIERALGPGWWSERPDSWYAPPGWPGRGDAGNPSRRRLGRNPEGDAGRAGG